MFLIQSEFLSGTEEKHVCLLYNFSMLWNDTTGAYPLRRTRRALILQHKPLLVSYPTDESTDA